MHDWFDIQYNHKSDLGKSWSSGTIRLGSAEEIAGWLYETTRKYGAVLVTEMKGNNEQ